MSIVFNAKDHSYKSNDDLEINWISVTTLVSHFKKPFDAETIAKKVIKNKKSKWYGLSSKEVLTIWNTESLRGALGI